MLFSFLSDLFDEQRKTLCKCDFKNFFVTIFKQIPCIWEGLWKHSQKSIFTDKFIKRNAFSEISV